MITRHLEERIKELITGFPVVYLTGPRQSGKTTLARMAFPDFKYLSLENPATRQEALEDPIGFLRQLEGARGVVLDEVQRTPDLFSYLQQIVDERRSGPFILTGSQQFALSEKISQSLAGRAAVVELMPFSLSEVLGRPPLDPDRINAPEKRTPPPGPLLPDDVLYRGMFPPVVGRQVDPIDWLDGYIATYVERDVRTLVNVGNLDSFRQFVGLCAGRAGQLLNLTAMGSDAGVSHSTAKKWMSVLQAGYVLTLIRPHHRNFNKRLVKTPKLYFLDTGVLCRLLGIRGPEDLRSHPLRGAIVENFVVSELLKAFYHRGRRPSLFFWRDTAGHEVDILIDLGNRIVPIEVKAGATLATDSFKGLDRYCTIAGIDSGVLVHGGEEMRVYGRHLARAWFNCS